MLNGQLILKVLDVYGKPVTEPVDVSLKNQTLSHAPSLRDLDVSTTKILTDLNVFPHGTYRLEIDSRSYHTVSRFVNIPPSGQGEVIITLPVNPKRVKSVEFPAYASLTDDVHTLLDNSPNVLNFTGLTGTALYDKLDDIRKAGLLNLAAKANRTRFISQTPPRTVMSYVTELNELRGDRFLADVQPDLRSETVNSTADELFHEVSEALHTPPIGFEMDRSFKTLDLYGNLQLSFFKSGDGRVALDMDIDDAQGFDHIFQVVGNLFGGPTHPYNIHEILIASQELDPGYRLML